MLSKKSILNPLRHKRATFVVACLTTLVCLLIISEEETAVRIYNNVTDIAAAFFEKLRSQFISYVA